MRGWWFFVWSFVVLFLSCRVLCCCVVVLLFLWCRVVGCSCCVFVCVTWFSSYSYATPIIDVLNPLLLHTDAGQTYTYYNLALIWMFTKLS